MYNIEVRTFMLGKEAPVTPTSQDALAVDRSGLRFAVADGVSNSYCPEIVAQALCDDFVHSLYRPQVWAQKIEESLQRISLLWNDTVLRREEAATGRQQRFVEYCRNELPMGSSTFAGLKIDPFTAMVHYCVLGDSTVFAVSSPVGAVPVPHAHKDAFVAVSSSPTEMRQGHSYILYDNYPDCITSGLPNSQGTPHLLTPQFPAQWRIGSMPLRPGYLALMTDAAAEWLQDQLMESTSVMDSLWDLDTDQKLSDFVLSHRAEGDFDDDVAIILIKVSPHLLGVDVPRPVAVMSAPQGDPDDMLWSELDLDRAIDMHLWQMYH